jgi:hypothetical protein
MPDRLTVCTNGGIVVSGQVEVLNIRRAGNGDGPQLLRLLQTVARA